MYTPSNNILKKIPLLFTLCFFAIALLAQNEKKKFVGTHITLGTGFCGFLLRDQQIMTPSIILLQELIIPNKFLSVGIFALVWNIHTVT